MPDSVDSPAPESTTAPPADSRSVSSSTPSTVAGAAVTGPSSPRIGVRARTGSADRDLAVQPLEQRIVDAGQALGREGALEEPADAPGTGPLAADPDGAPALVGAVHRPRGDHAGVRVPLDQLAGGALGDRDVLHAGPLGRRLQPPVRAGARALAAGVHPVLAVLLGQHLRTHDLVVGERGADGVLRCPHDPFGGGDDLTHAPILPRRVISSPPRHSGRASTGYSCASSAFRNWQRKRAPAMASVNRPSHRGSCAGKLANTRSSSTSGRPSRPVQVRRTSTRVMPSTSSWAVVQRAAAMDRSRNWRSRAESRRTGTPPPSAGDRTSLSTHTARPASRATSTSAASSPTMQAR